MFDGLANGEIDFTSLITEYGTEDSKKKTYFYHILS